MATTKAKQYSRNQLSKAKQYSRNQLSGGVSTSMYRFINNVIDRLVKKPIPYQFSSIEIKIVLHIKQVMMYTA